MTRISLSTAFVASLLASSALAAPPLKRASVPGNDNGACAATFGRCVKGVKKAGAHVFFDNPFGFSDQCTIAAVCYDANVDDFLYDVYRQVPHGRRHRPHSKTSPRLTQTQYNRIAYSPIHKRELEARALATQQNFVDYFYTTLSRSGGPYPDIDYVTNLWSEISAWTGFCDSRSIPYGNLADWFQYYSSSNYSPMCGATTSTAVTGGTTSVTGGTTTVNGGTTTVNSGTTTVVSGTTTVIGGTTSVIGGTTVTVTGTPVVSTFTTTQAGTTVTTTDASGNTVTTTASPTTVTVTTTATTTGTAATASPSNFVVTDANGNPVGYLSTTGTITQNPNDALTPQSAGTSAKRQTTLIDLFSAGTNNFFCGRGGDLSGQTSYIEASGCQTSTGAGANHTALAYETTIFSIDSTGELSVFWVNNDGMTLPVTLTMGTHNRVPQTLLFVLDAAAPVFDGNVAGTPLTAKGQNVDEQASTFSSSMASSSSVPLASSAMSSMLSSVLPSGTDSSLLPSMTSLDMSATSVLPSTDSSLLASMTSLNMSATSVLPSVTDSSLLPSVTSLNMSATSILPSTSDVLSSSASESSSATASSSSSAPSPTASVLAAMDAAGNVVGYFSVDGTLTQDPNDALSPMAAQSSRSKRWNLFGNAKRETGQLVNLFSPNTNNYLCGIGEDLTDSNSVATGGCDETTFIGQTHEATGYETAIFSIVNGALQALWVNNNGTSIDPVIFTYGTFNNVSNTLLFVKNAAAPVFDNGASGATVTATAMPAPANDTTSSTDAGSSTSASIAPSSSAAEASSSKAAESSSSSASEASSSSAAEASSSSAAEASSSSAEASSSSAAEVSSSSAEASSSSAEVSSSSAAAASSSSAEASSSSAEASSSSAAEASSSSAEASSSSAEASSSSAEASSISAAEASSSSAAEATSSSAAEATPTA